MTTGKRATRWSANDYAFDIAKIPILSGRGTQTFLEIAQQNQDFDYQAGIDGEGVFFENLNHYTLLNLYLMQTSAGNAVLTALHTASKVAGGLLYPISGQDSKGTSKIVSEAAMILKMPDEAFAREPGVITWMIGVHDPDRIIGSH